MRPNGRQRFQKVVVRRTEKTLKALRLLRKCFTAPHYKYTDEEAQIVMKAIDEQVERIRFSIRQPVEDFTLHEGQPEQWPGTR